MARTRDELWLDNRCVLANRVKQRVYRVWSRSRTQAEWKGYRVACLHVLWFIKMLNKHSRNGANHS